MVGCAAGEGHLGALASKDSVWIAEALHACLSQIARAAKASLIVLKDFSSKYRDVLAEYFRQRVYPRAEHAHDPIGVIFVTLMIICAFELWHAQKFAAKISQNRTRCQNRSRNR